MAQRHKEFLDAGAMIVGISVDAVGQNAAMVDALRLPFPILSDPDRTVAIDPYGLPNPTDPRELAIPAVVAIDADGEEHDRIVSRDFADRPSETAVLDLVLGMGLAPTVQSAPEPGQPEPGPKAMPAEKLDPYFRGAKFAVKALALRVPEAGDESAAFIEQMDRYLDTLKRLKRSG